MALVRMYHPASDRYQDASDAAFEQFWQHEGWVLAPVDEAPAVDEAPKKRSRSE